MSNTTPNPAGRFVTKRVTRPAIDVDCSKWVDTTGGGWTFGSFVTKNQTRDAVAVECSNWAAEPAMWLELVVSFGVDADLTAVETVTLKLIQAAHDAAPELGLTYDVARSKVVNGDVVIALTPKNPAGAEGRLLDVIRQFRAALASGNGAKLELVGASLRWARATEPEVLHV